MTKEMTNSQNLKESDVKIKKTRILRDDPLTYPCRLPHLRPSGMATFAPILSTNLGALYACKHEDGNMDMSEKPRDHKACRRCVWIIKSSAKAGRR